MAYDSINSWQRKIMSVEIVKKRLKIISDLEGEINKIRNVFQESLEDNSDYQKVQEEEQKFKEQTKERKQRVKSMPNIMAIDTELKDLRKQLKENKEILAIELADYYRDSGSLEIVDVDGVKKRIVFSVKLISNQKD